MEKIILNTDQAAEAIYALFQANSWIIKSTEVSPDALHYEASAQQAVLDFCEERVSDFDALPKSVANLASMLLMDFLSKLIDPNSAFQGAQWEVPKNLPQEAQARHVIASEIHQTIAPHQEPH